MITSTAPGNILDKLRRISGPNPEGSKLTDAERLHLIWLLTALAAAIEDEQGPSVATVVDVQCMLADRGLSGKDMKAIISQHAAMTPIELADAIAVHPSLREAYLD